MVSLEIHRKEVFPWIVCCACAGTIDFCPALAALVSSVYVKYYSPPRTLFHFTCPHRPATWAGRRAGSPVSVSLRSTIIACPWTTKHSVKFPDFFPTVKHLTRDAFPPVIASNLPV
jgi:hypothetical protein